MTISTQALRKLAEKATPGPWWRGPLPEGTGACYVMAKAKPGGPHCRGDERAYIVADCGWRPNTEFVAAASPSTILLMLDAIELAVACLEEIPAGGYLTRNQMMLAGALANFSKKEARDG